jgi:hypothetical protein
MARMIAGGVASVAVAFVPAARAGEPCAAAVTSQGLSPRWTAAAVELREQIAGLAGSECQPMILSVEPFDGGVRLVATTPDGRRAERAVRRPEDLVATALGLLLAIPGEVDGRPPPSPPPPAPAPTSPAPSTPEARAPLPAVAPTVVPARRIGVWAGLSAGLRLTAPTAVTVLDVEARADVLFDRWLMMATVRSALISCLGQQGLDCDVYEDVSLGVGVGRRFHAGPAAVDLAFEPSFVVMHMEYDAPGGSEGESWDGTVATLRADVSARLALPLGDSWVLTVTIDGGLAPSILANPTRLQVPESTTAGNPPPPFPAWTGGLRLGASGALL